MKKKIAIYALLCALLVGLMPPSSARAEMCEKSRIYYDAENNMICVENGCTKKLSDDAIALIENGYKLCVYTLADSERTNCSYYCRIFFVPDGCEMGFLSDGGTEYIVPLKNGEPISPTATVEIYQCNYILNSDGFRAWQGMTKYDSAYYSVIAMKENYFVNFVYSEVPVYTLRREGSSIVVSNEIYYEKDMVGYTFENWCADADLNCSASSSDMSTMPYVYHSDYMHIVRKSDDGDYWLTVIYDYENSPYVLACSGYGDSKTQLHLATRNSSSSSGVYTYRYNADGWQYVGNTTYTFSPTSWADLGFYINGDSGYTLEYTNRDIYSSLNASAPYISATVEYVDGDIYDDVVMVTPTPEPTTDDGALLENINDMVEVVSAVPQIIKAVFSFLPPWCLTLVGIGFAILVVIMVRRGTIG